MTPLLPGNYETVPPLRTASRDHWLTWSLLAALCWLSFFWRLGGNGIWDLDEALYSESAREMQLSGDFVTPRVNAQPFFEKPPLIYWEAAGLFTLFGRSETTARLPSALASAALVCILFVAGTRLFGRRAGALAAIFYAASPLVFGAARQLTTDSTLTLCITAALLCFAGAVELRGRRSTACGMLFWVFCGLGVLCKGLPGILIPVLVAVLSAGFNARWRFRAAGTSLLRLNPAIGLVLFLAIILPWHLLAWKQSGDAFVHEYIVVQHLARFRGGDTAHRAPFWFFIPGFLAGFFPLSIYLPAALLEQWKDQDLSGDASESRSRPRRLRVFLKVWAVAVFVMFSASGSKLISYILPMYPPAALLVGDWCSRAMDNPQGLRSLKRGAWFVLSVTALLTIVLLFRDSVISFVEASSRRPVRLDDIPAGTFEWAMHLFGALALAAAAFVVLLQRGKPTRAFGALAAGMAVFLGIAIVEGFPLLNGSLVAPLQQIARVGGRHARAMDSRLALYLGPPRRPSALFYLPDLLIQNTGADGASRVAEIMDPPDSTSNIGAFLAENPRAVIVTDTRRVAALISTFGMRVVDRRGKWHVLLREDGTKTDERPASPRETGR